MTKPTHQCKPQPAATARVINLARPADPIAPAQSAPATDPRSNYFANSNGSRWGRELRSN